MIEFLGQPTKIDVVVNNQPLSNIGEMTDIDFTLIKSKTKIETFDLNIYIDSPTLKTVLLGWDIKVYFTDPYNFRFLIFGGIITQLQSFPERQSYRKQMLLNIKCKSYKYILQHRSISFYVNPSSIPTFKTLITNTINNFLLSDNFKLGNIQNDNNLPSGYNFKLGTVLEFFDDLANISGYVWEVLEDGTINFIEEYNKQFLNTKINDFGIIKSSINSLDNYFNKHIVTDGLLTAEIEDTTEINKFKSRFGNGVYGKINRVMSDGLEAVNLNTLAQKLTQTTSYEKQLFTLQYFNYIPCNSYFNLTWQDTTFTVLVTEVTGKLVGTSVVFDIEVETIPPAPKVLDIKSNWIYKLKNLVTVNNNNSTKLDKKSKNTLLVRSSNVDFKLYGKDKPIFTFTCDVNIQANSSNSLELLINNVTNKRIPLINNGTSAINYPLSTIWESTNILNSGTNNFKVNLTGNKATISNSTFKLESPEIFNEKNILTRNVIEQELDLFTTSQPQVFEFDGNIIEG